MKWGVTGSFSHLEVKGSSRGAARGGAGGLPVGGGFSGSSNNLESGQEASEGAGLRFPDLPGVYRGEMSSRLTQRPQAPLQGTPSTVPAHLGSWLPRDTEGTLLFAPASSLSMLIHSGGGRERRLRGDLGSWTVGRFQLLSVQAHLQPWLHNFQIFQGF